MDKLISKIILCSGCQEFLVQTELETPDADLRSHHAASEVGGITLFLGINPVYSNCFLNFEGGKVAQSVFEGRQLQSPADGIL